MSPFRRTALVVLLAILGIAVAAAITWGTSQLVRQRIGLASEPLTAGRRLLPRARRRTAPSARSHGTATTSTGGGEAATSTATAPSATTAPSTATAPPAPPGTASEGTPRAPAGGEAGAAGGRSGGEGGDAGSRRDD